MHGREREKKNDLRKSSGGNEREKKILDGVATPIAATLKQERSSAAKVRIITSISCDGRSLEQYLQLRFWLSLRRLEEKVCEILPTVIYIREK